MGEEELERKSLEGMIGPGDVEYETEMERASEVEEDWLTCWGGCE